MDVNFFGALHCTKAALPALLERRGQVVVLGSVAGLAPLATRTGYAASKHAVHGFFESLRAEYPDGRLGVLLVDPSFVDTPIGEHALGPDGRAPGSEARTGVRGAIAPEAVADAILRALLARRRHLFVPWQAGAFVWLSRLAPRLFERGMARRTAR
jgi:short-subunit dehydrogenase